MKHAFFIVTQNAEVWDALMDLGYTALTDHPPGIYILFNDPTQNMPAEYKSECIFTDSAFFTGERW